MKKNFAILKWLIFPALVLSLALGIGYVSYQMFGVDGSILYWILLGCIVAISLILVLHTGNHENENAKIAAFIFETIGIFALGVTVIAALTVSRELAGSKISGTQETQKIEAIGKLKSAKAQNTLANKLETSTDSIAEAYKRAERILFWPLVAETILYFGALATVFGLTIFGVSRDSTEDTPRHSSRDSIDTPRHSTRHSTQVANASFRASTASPNGIENGKGSVFKFVKSGANHALHFKAKRGEHFKYVCYVTAPELAVLESLPFSALAEEAMKRRMQKHGSDSIVESIKQSL